MSSFWTIHRTEPTVSPVAPRIAASLRVTSSLVVADAARQRLDVADNSREIAAAGGTRGLHGGVQRKRIRLCGDLRDGAHDDVDLRRGLNEPLGACRGGLCGRAAHRNDVAGLTDAVDRLGDRGAQPLGCRSHRRHVRHRALGDERRFHRLAFRDGRHARQLARGLVHGLDAVRNAQQDRAHDPVEPADCVFKRLAPFLDAFSMRDVGAQPVALLQRTLQHDDGARDVSDLVGPLGAGHFRLPVAARDTAHRLGDLHQRPS